MQPGGILIIDGFNPGHLDTMICASELLAPFRSSSLPVVLFWYCFYNHFFFLFA